ncbi:MAG: YbaB/EbfC family nucleoid-associated protein [Planctomycetota bacterium]
MFDSMRAVGALAGLLRDKQKLAEAAERVRRTLDGARAEGSAGGGAVRVTASGALRIVEVRLEPAMLAGLGSGDESRALAEGLIAEATNEALTAAQAIARRTVADEAQELGLPEDIAGQFGAAMGL